MKIAAVAMTLAAALVTTMAAGAVASLGGPMTARRAGAALSRVEGTTVAPLAGRRTASSEASAGGSAGAGIRMGGSRGAGPETVSTGRGAAGASPTAMEYQLKANFLAQTANFTEWPEKAFASAKDGFAICTFGDFLFGTALAEATKRETFHGRKVAVRWARELQELRACQIVFVSGSEEGQYAKVLQAVAGGQVLTVGETNKFLGAGGAVYLAFEEDELQFEVNLKAVNDAELKMNYRMLKMARRVVNAPETAKK